MKTILLLSCSLLISCMSYAGGSEGYTLATTTGGVECYYQFSTCNGNPVVMLQFNNTNPGAVNISWKEVFNTVQVPEAKEGYATKTMTLAPGNTGAACDDKDHKALIIGAADVNPTYKADITHFEFKDVTITPSK